MGEPFQHFVLIDAATASTHANLSPPGSNRFGDGLNPAPQLFAFPDMCRNSYTDLSLTT